MPIFDRKFTRSSKNGKKDPKKDMPSGLWKKCPDCGEIIFNKKFLEYHKVCPKCAYHFTLTAKERIELIADYGSF